jgi:hypothetical protein
MSEDIERMIEEVVGLEEPPAPPSVNAPMGAVQQQPSKVHSVGPLFEDDELLSLASETLNNMRGDRKQLDTLISNFVEMVFNEGDSTTASKEALVSLMVAKTNMSDKQMKLLEMIAKFKLKEMADTPKTVTVQENYHFGGSRRSFLDQIDKRIKKKKNEEKKDA